MEQPVKFHLHHIDGDHFNNELDNLQILCPNCHSMTDNYGVYNSNRYKQKHYCNDCGKEIRKNKTGLCVDCYHKFRSQKKKYKSQKTCSISKTNNKDVHSKKCIICSNKSNIHKLPDTLSRDNLKYLIRTKPFTSIAKDFNVSDNAIRKWCVKYNLPQKSREIKLYSDEEWTNI